MKPRNKYEKITYLRQSGANTENSVCIKDASDYIRHWPEIERWKTISIRTFKPDAGYTPHIPYMAVTDAYNTIHELLYDGWTVIVAEGINPKHAVLAGAIWRKRESLVIELAEGPNTTRRVTHDGKIDVWIEVTDMPQIWAITDERIKEILKEIFKTGLLNVVFEVSYYNKPVGCYRRQAIVWDYTK